MSTSSARPKDLDWGLSGLDAGLFSPEIMAARLTEVADISDATRDLAGKRLAEMAPR